MGTQLVRSFTHLLMKVKLLSTSTRVGSSPNTYAGKESNMSQTVAYGSIGISSGPNQITVGRLNATST